MKTPYRSALAALVLAGSTFSAHAWTTSVTSGSFSDMVGAVTTDFGFSTPNNYGPVSGPLPSNYSGGALFNFGSSSTLPNGISARPVGSTGNFWSIGTSPDAQDGPGIVTFAAPVSYFGFLWGSPDAYNQVSFYDGGHLLGSYNGSAIKVPPNGDQSYARYFNVFAGQGEKITRVVFASGSNAFETDNHAVVSAVPEPETYAMLLAGFALLGWHGRRRTRKQ